MLNLLRLVLAIALILTVVAARADDAIIGVPSLMSEGPNLTLHQNVIGRACFSIAATRLDLDCNPAFLADSDKRLVRLNAVANDETKNLFDAYRGLKSDDALYVADEILNDHDPKQAMASTAVWFQKEYWAIGVVPVRTGLSYLNRNAAYPQISLYGLQESEAFYKVGLLSADNRNLKLGIQTRYVARKYIYQKFYALDALADPDIIEMKRQRALYIEPGFSYQFDAAWKPTLAAMITNMPVYQSGSKLPTRPEFDLGLSTSYADLIPNFRSTTHYHRAAGSDFGHAFSWSGIYDFKQAAASVTLGEGLFGAGLDGNVGPFVLGLGYRNERIKIDSWNKRNVESTFAELGLQF